MTDKVKHAGLPVCENEYEGFRYLAISPMSVVESGSIPEEEINSPPLKNLTLYSDYYQSSDMCHVPAKNGGKDKFFLIFPFKFDVGGQDHPYSDSIPDCDEADTLFRAAAATPLTPDGEKSGPMLLVLHEEALISPKWLPITDENVDQLGKHLSSINIDSICQKRISDEPERYGVFFVERAPMKTDPFEKISDKAGSNDFDSHMALYESIIQATPRALRTCIMPVEDIIHIGRWNEALRELRLMADASAGDFYIRDILAPALTWELIEDAALVDMNDAQVSTLEAIVSFGIEGGLAEEEIGDIAARLSNTYSDSQKVVYGLFAAVSLRVANKLHLLNEGNGGISDDFADFSESIEKAITDGRVNITVQSARDNFKNPSALAIYRGWVNEIVFPPLDSGASPAAFFESIVHECYHAYQDMKGVEMTALESEEGAYTRGFKAELLLNSARGFDADPLMGVLNSESLEYANALDEWSYKTMECQNIPPEAMEMMREFKSEMAEAQINWRHAVQSNLLSGTDYDEHGFFVEFFRIANYDIVTSIHANRALYSKGYEYDACVDSKGVEACNSEFLSIVDSYENGYRVFPETAEGAEEVRDFLYSQAYAMSAAFYADKQLWAKMFIYETFDRDSAMDALMMTMREKDGI